MTEQELLLSYRAENWREICGYGQLYDISDQGHVRSVSRVIEVAGHGKQSRRTVPGRVLRAASTRGYLCVSLWRQNVGRTLAVHLLVAESFLGLTVGAERPCHWCGTPVTKRAKATLSFGGMTVDHYDHDTQNNTPENLVPSCNPCNAHRLSNTNWLPWEPGQPTGRDDLSHPTCGDGHEWTPENTYTNPTTGSRKCRTCRRLTKRIWDDARRGA